MSPRPPAVLLDLDGTLIDSTELIVQSYRYTLGKVTGRTVDRDEIVSGFGTPLVENLKRMSPDPELVPELMEVYSEYNGRRHDELVTVFPGAVETVEALREDGVRLAIVTGKRRKYALMGLELAGLTEAFPVVITPESTARGKPHAEPVEAALSGLNSQAEDALMVGDSPHDIASARAAGVRSAAVGWGPFKRSILEEARPNYWLDSWGELLGLVSSSNGAV